MPSVYDAFLTLESWKSHTQPCLFKPTSSLACLFSFNVTAFVVGGVFFPVRYSLLEITEILSIQYLPYDFPHADDLACQIEHLPPVTRGAKCSRFWILHHHGAVRARHAPYWMEGTQLSLWSGQRYSSLLFAEHVVSEDIINMTVRDE